MIILPAIDLLGRKAVRLLKGDYNQVTVYSDSPLEVAEKFKSLGATHIHMVDLDGAKYGTAPNMDIVAEVAEKTGLFIEIGGGIRSMETVKKYIDAGISRVILGTAAICDEDFLKEAVKAYGEKIAVGADVKDGKIAVKGWLEQSDVTLDEFFLKMQDLGVKNIICTDISRDGAMRGTNLELYRELSEKYSLDITASGGVSSIEDVKRLREMNLYGAIIGKAYYTGAVDLEEAIEVAR
ncbi:MAG: 1-(5-phosphoribosyl)-5-[(5-phosphoribosylamino)methylideneamino]imidazole-4-carboxamide isomerase [Oscillospiraceae bacterium]|nr:1-(5-phosphoribosyl)-5-[(5-phosphoribosylamino)methylideneamino]imidazole-4-carboxamide isomerase [Ruminococcus sp.]MDY3087947.1 1-(5-phosphoribosyl)-5-[(5-phosphoribosylamino)methylideneamino]imidazole-4-carboxamide isomerase [Oscillospiraceae bacterium]